MKKRKWIWGLVLLLFFWGEMAAAAEKGSESLEKLLQERGIYAEDFAWKELWRKELGRERSLLLYIDEKGEYHICFTDGPWVYLTEEAVERVKEAGLRLWENGGVQ